MQNFRALPGSRFPIALGGLAALFASCHGEGSGGERQPISTFNPGFELRQDVQLGTGSVTDAVVIDLDGDGIDDVVETDFFDRKIRSARGNVDGSFTPFFELALPSTPWAIETGDFDGDGEVDLAAICVGSGGTPSAIVFRGLGDGSFAQDAVLNLPDEPLDLGVGRPTGAIADHLFVVMPGVETQELALSAPGTLSLVAQLPSTLLGSYQPATVAVVDANGDGNPDVVVGERTGDPGLTDQIVVHVSDGVGGYAAPSILSPIAFYPIVDVAGDVDGDGTLDLMAAQLESDRALLFLGTAGVGLGAPIEVNFTGPSSSILFHDLNGDGLKDVAATLVEDDAIAVRLATTPLAFGPQRSFNVGQLPRAIAVGTFGGDSHLDLLCSNIRDLSVLAGDGAGNFRAAEGFVVGDEPQFVRVVDMDGDGLVDVVSIDQFQNRVVFMKGHGDGTFTNMGQVPLTPSLTETAGYLLIRDFDEDGRPDVATTVNTTGTVQLMQNSGSLPFTQPDSNDSTSIGADPLGLDSQDVDSDGHLDIVVANSGDNTIQLLKGNGDGTFAPQTPVAAPFRPLVVALGDFDGDGDEDAAVSTDEPDGSDSFLLLYEGDGAGNLTLTQTQALPQLASVLSLGDFDEDGLPDIAASQPRAGADDVLVLLNRDNFVFTIRPVKVGFRMGTVEIFDINNDTHLDLIIPLKDGALILALGDGEGRFPTLLPPSGEQFPAPFGATASAFADVDLDGKPDLLTVSPNNPHLWVAINDGSVIK